MQPVIELVERASMHPTPVQFPRYFQGFRTLLPYIQSSRSILRLLSLDCEYAYSKNDTKQALRDLTLMQSTAKAFDMRDCGVSRLVNNALQGMRLSSVRRTLTHCVWDESQLGALRGLVVLTSDEDLAAPLRQTWSSERAFLLASLNEIPASELYQLAGQKSPLTHRPFLPSDRQILIKYFNDMLEIGGESLLQWKIGAEKLERTLDVLNSPATLLIPATAQVISSEIRAEEIRRWTLTAIGLRQYHQQNDKWPNHLSDLETVGLVFDDYSNLHGMMFGYEVDGETAYLWKSDDNAGGESDRTGYISPKRPTLQKKGYEDDTRAKEALDAYLLELR
jgi:hypothetical protein